MEKSPFALSVDNSLLDSIHPLSNSNSGKVSCTAYRVCTYCINKQTRKHTAAYRPALVIRMCTYTNPRNKPDAEGKGGSCRCVYLENKNASFETCILNSPDSPLLASVTPIHPMYIPHPPPVVTALCDWQRTFARLRAVLAYFSSRIRNVPCLWFFRFFLYLIPQYFSNSPNTLVRKTHSTCGDVRATLPTWMYFLYKSMHLCVSFSAVSTFFLVLRGIVCQLKLQSTKETFFNITNIIIAFDFLINKTFRIK